MTINLKVHGVNVPLAETDVSPTIWSALKSGAYEAKEARWIFKSIKPGDRVLELGTGIGIVTSLIASVPDVQVWGFEASPSSVELARRVLAANGNDNVVITQGILAAGEPRDFTFYTRKDLWMSSLVEHQGPYQDTLQITSADIDAFIADHAINVLVMDIEGAELELLLEACLPGIMRIFLELHDHLYGLDGIRAITQALADKGFAYDPRGSSGPCVLFSNDTAPRDYVPEEAHE